MCICKFCSLNDIIFQTFLAKPDIFPDGIMINECFLANVSQMTKIIPAINFTQANPVY